ncbi:uncharacterized protein LOC144653920 [Oculina patagonica]
MKSFFVLTFLLCIHVDTSTSTNINTSTIEPLTSHTTGFLPVSTVPGTASTVTSTKKKGGGLKCYGCYSTEDWNKCKEIQQEYDCSEDEEQCFQLLHYGEKGHVQAGTYMKGCASSDKCKQLKEEKCRTEDFAVPGIKCEITWCTGDLCNAAAPPVVSVIIFIACTCLAFLY